MNFPSSILVLFTALLLCATVQILANSCIKTFTVKGKDYLFNLNPLSNRAGYIAKGRDNYNYYISFCSPVTAPAASCAKDGSYKGWQLSDDKHNCFPIAMDGDGGVSMELIDPDNINGGILLKMKTVDGTYNRGAEIQVSCQNDTTAVRDVSVTEKKDGLYTSIYHFDMKSSYACIVNETKTKRPRDGTLDEEEETNPAPEQVKRLKTENQNLRKKNLDYLRQLRVMYVQKVKDIDDQIEEMTTTTEVDAEGRISWMKTFFCSSLVQKICSA